MTKYLIEIISTGREYRPVQGWDDLYTTRSEALDAAKKASAQFQAARVVTVEVPARVDHLYRRITYHDTTALY